MIAQITFPGNKKIEYIEIEGAEYDRDEKTLLFTMGSNRYAFAWDASVRLMTDTGQVLDVFQVAGAPKKEPA